MVINRLGLLLCCAVVLASSALADDAPVPRPVLTDDNVTAGSMSFTPAGIGLGESLRPQPRETWARPALAWDGVVGAEAWRGAVMAALDGPASPLLDVVPADIGTWCPAYPRADARQRTAFWAGLVSTLAFYESTHNPDAVGGEGRWFGLLQITPATARGYSCEAGTASDLLDGPANVRCGLRIMAATVARDGVVSEGMAGVAADWGPFHSGRKRAAMRDWVSRQAYCVPGLRPVLRPTRFDNADIAGRPVPRPI
ncbi:MAG: transglycosylase SLT domain-containing protein [Pseudomonadota bacterium]